MATVVILVFNIRVSNGGNDGDDDDDDDHHHTTKKGDLQYV